jgi:RimJ/RimL family protein N-acetyltransferase
VLELPELVGFTRPENLRSRRVLEELAFTFERTFVADDKKSVLYRPHSHVRP